MELHRVLSATSARASDYATRVLPHTSPSDTTRHPTRATLSLSAPIRALIVAAVLALCALALSACGNTIQDQPIARSALEPMVLNSHYPVYWLGGAFHNLAITEAAHDPGGAYTLHYGDCTEGGQYTCVTPLTIVTSPDNSFIPGGASPRRTVALRGLHATLAQQGATIEIPTGPVVVSIYANSPALARAAALMMVPINLAGIPGEPLPAALPNTGFSSEPLASQKPLEVHIPGVPGTPRRRTRQ
jgi:hypothetical protein